MGTRETPLYTAAHAVALELHSMAPRWSRLAHGGLAGAVGAQSRALLTSTALALSFPATRARHQEAADEALESLRVLLRLAEDLGLLSEPAALPLHRRLCDIGRMLGGWRKRTARGPPVA